MGIFAEKKKKKKEDDPLPTVVRYTTKNHQLQNAIKTHRQFEGWVKNQKKKTKIPPGKANGFAHVGMSLAGAVSKKRQRQEKPLP